MSELKLRPLKKMQRNSGLGRWISGSDAGRMKGAAVNVLTIMGADK
jgi:hypothetical protein